MRAERRYTVTKIIIFQGGKGMIFFGSTLIVLLILNIFMSYTNGKLIGDLEEAVNDAILAKCDGKIEYTPIEKGVMVKEG